MNIEFIGEGQKRPEPVTVRDPDDKRLVVAPEDINEVNLKHCKDNLKKKDQDDCYDQAMR